MKFVRIGTIVTLAVAVACLVTPQTAHAKADGGFVTGLSVMSFGAAAAIVSGIGSTAYIAQREHSGTWGWISLFSGIATTVGGIVVLELEPWARTGGSAAIAVGVLSVGVGMVGLVLEGPEAKHRDLYWTPQVSSVWGDGVRGGCAGLIFGVGKRL